MNEQEFEKQGLQRLEAVLREVPFVKDVKVEQQPPHSGWDAEVVVRYFQAEAGESDRLRGAGLVDTTLRNRPSSAGRCDPVCGVAGTWRQVLRSRRANTGCCRQSRTRDW